MNENLESLTGEVRLLLTSNKHQPESVAPLLGGDDHGELLPVCRRNLKVQIGDDLWRLYSLQFGDEHILVYKHSSLDEVELTNVYTAWAARYKLEHEEVL